MELTQRLQKYRLSRAEYDRACQLLGREPQGVEWALFSSLWSEHCSYKSSKVHLKKLFRKNDRVLEAEGENAGVVDLGQGERVAFKMESHNHPSFIEPYQGAATGVGGILRDIFTMGARPIALADYLCFGQPQAPRMKTLVDGVVRGIGGYGNCVGVPTITGQTEFHASYNGNILVNAMAVGLFRPGEKVFLSKAKGLGNYVVYVGAKTGRDGVHGASMASESFDESSESKRPTVQIGDPFFEKLLIESCLEVMRQDLVVAIQDMGAAGLTSSSFEMASKGQVGFDLHLDRVPLRDSTISPEEILLSESQERMLLICEPRNFEKLQSVFHKWELEATVIGDVKPERRVRLYWQNELLTDVDPDLFVENAPEHDRPYEAYQSPHWVSQLKPMARTAAAEAELLKALSSAEGCSRSWIYRQYDQRVGTQTVHDCEDSIAVVRLPDSKRALGIVLGCRPHVMRQDAALGGADSVLYPSLELAAKGFEALAVTDCLNFGNPEKPQTMGEFVASLQSLSGACELLNAPIISGNVSFYNETLDKGISPTPSTGLIGLKDDLTYLPTSTWQKGEHDVFALTSGSVMSAGYWAELIGQPQQLWGEWNPQEMARFVGLVRDLVRTVPVQATRVVGKFGWAYAFARMAQAGVGAHVRLPRSMQLFEGSLGLFGEPFYHVIVTVQAAHSAALKAQFEKLASGSNFELEHLGETGGSELEIAGRLHLSVEEMRNQYRDGWRKHFEELA